MSDVSCEARREEVEVNAGVSGVSTAASVPETNHQRNTENPGKNPLVDGNPSGSFTN